MMDSDFYTASASNVNRTVLSGAPGRAQQAAAPRQPAAEATAPQHGAMREPMYGANGPMPGAIFGSTSERETLVELQDRPLAGVLLSASADGMGEIFPLYIGRNMVGSNPDADIYLAEATVSVNHAVILVRMIDDPATGRPRMQVSLTDYDSEYGTMVGQERAGFDRVPLRGGDVLRVGYGYTFILYLFDSSIPGFGQNAAFRALPRVRKRREPDPEAIAAAMAAGARQAAEAAAAQAAATPAQPEEVFPDSVGAADEFAFYGRTAKAPDSHSRNATIDNMSAFYSQTPGSEAAKTVLNPQPGGNSAPGTRQ